MKLPVLNVTSLPTLYKHCSTVQLLHINISDEGVQENATFVKDYLDYILEQIYISVEAFFVTSLATRITSHGETYVIFKSNTEKRVLSTFVEALLAEVDQYCDQHISLSYQYMEAILFLEGNLVKMFRSGKLGEEVKDSAIYKKNTVVYDHKKKPRGKQLLDLEEYRKQYDKLKKFPPRNTDNSKTPISSNEDENVCEYYI